jgi:hypothetical protein
MIFIYFFSAEEINEYHISTTGAKITTDSSINVLYQYCVKLSKDKYGDYILILFLFCVATHMIHIKKIETPSFYLVLFLCVEGSNSFFPNVMLY